MAAGRHGTVPGSVAWGAANWAEESTGVDVTGIGVLGPLRLGDGSVVLGAMQRRLLSALAVEANRVVAIDRLVDALWGDRAGSGATATVHSHVSRLRRNLSAAGAAAGVVTDSGGYRLEVELTELDALLFLDLLHRARNSGADLAERRRRLEGALGLWRGPAYADLPDDDLARAEAARLDDLRLVACEDLAEALLEDGRPAEALDSLELLVRQHPFRERLWSSLILARYRAGRQAEALEAFHSYRETLDRELGLQPSPALTQLHQDVLQQAPWLAPAPRRPAATAADLPAARVAASPDGRPAPPPAPDPPAPDPPAERKLVTVLAAGLPGGAPDDDPEELSARLEPLVSALLEVAHRFGGTVLQASVSGLTVLFGAPVAVEDHAARACRAALAMQESLAGLDRGSTASLALDSGEVLLGAVRSDTTVGYDVVGAVVDRARRALSGAGKATILVSDATCRLADGLLSVDPADPGDGEWRRLRAVPETSAWEVRARLGLSTLVGREQQLTVLSGLADEVAAGAGRVAGVVGEPGVGKSRLTYELLCRLPAEWQRVTVVASSLDTAVPFRPLLPPVRGLLRSSPGSPPSALAALLGMPLPESDGEEWERLDPGVRRRRTIAAATDLVLQAATAGPLVLLVEDAHWLDGETLAVLDALVDRISSAPVLLVVTYRPEHQPGWGNRSAFTPLHVGPLAGEDATVLVESLLGDDPSVRGLPDQLARWTGGVPLFLEESVRALADTQALTGAPGRYLLADGTAPLRLPPRIQGVLAARIDRLPRSQKALLQAAAVIGAEGSVALLGELAGHGADETEDDLAGLHRAELLYERRDSTGRRFAFKHATVLDTAYASLPRARRRDLHASVLDLLAAGSVGAGDDLERRAHHASLAERWAESVALHSEAGALALQRCAFREAATLLERALESQRRLPPDPAREIDLHLQLRPAMHALCAFDRGLDRLARAEELAERSGDAARLQLVVLHQGYLLLTRGHVDAALRAVHRALDLAEAAGSRELAAECRLALGHCLTFSGDPAAAVPLLEQDMALRLAVPLEQRMAMAGTRPLFALAFLSMSLSLLGDFGPAVGRLAEADAVAARVARPIDSVVAALARGVLELQRGRPEAALPVLRDAHTLCDEAGMPLIRRWVEPVLAEALSGVGLVADSEACAWETLRAGVEHGVPLWQAAAQLSLARAALTDGRLEDAAQHSDEAVALAEQWRYPLTRATGLRLGAAALIRSGATGGARARATAAWEAATSLGARPEQARARALLATALEVAGRPAEAAAHATAAERLATELGLADLLPPGGRQT